MWNPFKVNQEQEIKQQQKQEADYQLTAASLGNPQNNMDENVRMDRREVLVQLSQWQQDRSPTMQKLFLKLSGYQFDDTQKMLVKIKWDEGFVSLKGAQKLVNYIEPLDHNVMLANWDTNNLIKTMREAIAHPLRRFIFMNHKEMGLELEHAEYVFWLITNTVEPTYWRGWNDGERRKDKEIIKINELRNPYFQEKKKGIFGMET